MSILYSIAGWDDHYECSASRKLLKLSWVPFPNKHDSDGYTELSDHPNGAAHYGCWVAAVQVASKCKPRGTLIRDSGKPHDAASLSRLTRFPKEVFEEAIPRWVAMEWVLTQVIDDEQDTEIRHSTTTPLPPDHHPDPDALSQKGREVYGSEVNRSEANGKEKSTTPAKAGTSVAVRRTDDVDAIWSHYKTHRPRARVLSPKARKLILAHLKAGYTVEDIQKAIDGNHKSPFHCGQNDQQEEHHRLDLIVRDSDQVQKFIDIADAPDKPVLGAKSQLTARAGESWLKKMEGRAIGDV